MPVAPIRATASVLESTPNDIRHVDVTRCIHTPEARSGWSDGAPWSDGGRREQRRRLDRDPPPHPPERAAYLFILINKASVGGVCGPRTALSAVKIVQNCLHVFPHILIPRCNKQKLKTLKQY